MHRRHDDTHTALPEHALDAVFAGQNLPDFDLVTHRL
jgi:hypothetical protein